MGDLIIQEPKAANHAATRRYADKVSLMATALDTRLPLYGNKHALNLSSATTNNEVAFGLNFVGIYDGLHFPLDFSLGTAFSGEYNMGKLSIGMSKLSQGYSYFFFIAQFGYKWIINIIFST